MGGDANAFKAYDLLVTQPVSVKDLPERERAGIVVSAVTDMRASFRNVFRCMAFSR